jgi:hypothetical protein
MDDASNTDRKADFIDFNELTKPEYVRPLIASASFSYGLYCIGVCLCLRKNISKNRSYLVSIPAFAASLAFQLKP